MGEDAAPRAPYAGVGWGRLRVPFHLPQLLTTDHAAFPGVATPPLAPSTPERKWEQAGPTRGRGWGRTGLHAASQGSGSPRNKRGGAGSPRVSSPAGGLAG